jgi:hypothetical protein
MAQRQKTTAKQTKKTVKKQYKVINWSQYNKALVDRGNFMLWISEEVIEQWRHENKDLKVGRPFVYSDRSMETILTLRELFRLTYRMTEGFVKGVFQLMQIDVSIPHFTAFAKRAKKLEVSLNASKIKGSVFLVVDSTGLKVYGEGEWKVRKYGWSKRRTWRKLHLAVNEKTQEIEAEVLASNATDDAAVVDELLDQATNRTKKFGGDGAYDKWKVYQTLSKRNIAPIIPPRKNAKIKRHRNGKLPPLPRDEAIRGIRKLGRAEWKRQIGYHRRSLAETAMYRMKALFGPTLKNRSDCGQKTEARLRCKILNHFTKLGMPKFVWQ